MPLSRRILTQRTYQSLYKKRKGEHCLYCNDVKEVYDHSPALHWIDSLGSAYFVERKISFVLVPCCRHCNSILGSKRLFTLKERAEHVFQYLAVEQYNLRMMEPHDPEDLKDMSGRLREEARAVIFQQLRAWERYEFAQKQSKKAKL